MRANNVVGSSAWVTTGLIQPADLAADVPAKSPLVFMNSFTNGLAGWTGQVGNVQVGAAAAMGDAGGQGLVAALGGGVEDQSVTSADQLAYVFHKLPAALGSYMANIYFNPNGAITSDTPVDIFTGLDANGVEIFGVQFLHTAGAPDLYQIRGWAKADEADVYTAWAPIVNAEQNIQLDWQSNLDSSLNLYLKGDIVAAVTADTSLFRLSETRLGPSRGIGDDDISASGVNASASGTIYLDEFVSLSTEATIPLSIYLPVMMK